MSNQTPSGTLHSLYDRAGNLLAETDGSGATGATREYIWLPDAEIAPTAGSRTKLDRPIAVVADVSTTVRKRSNNALRTMRDTSTGDARRKVPSPRCSR